MPSLIVQSTGESITFDSIEEEDHEHPANVVDHPVEEFGIDHRQRLPQTLQLEAYVTATPLVFGQDPEEGEPRPQLGVLANVFGDDRMRAALDFLLQNENEIWDYVSIRTGTIENLLLENLKYSSPREDWILFEMMFKEVQFGRSQLVDLPPLRRPPQEPPTEQNDQEGKEDDDELQRRTWLDRLSGGSGRGAAQGGLIEGVTNFADAVGGFLQ